MIPFIVGAAVGAFAASKVMSKDEPLYTTKDIAKLLDISEYTVRKKIREGAIKATVVPGKSGYRISESDLEEYKGNKKISDQAEELKPVGSFGKTVAAIFGSSDVDEIKKNVSPEYLSSLIEGRKMDLEGLNLKLKRLNLDKNSSKEFKREKLSLEIDINDLQAEIKALETAAISLGYTLKSDEKKTFENFSDKT